MVVALAFWNGNSVILLFRIQKLETEEHFGECKPLRIEELLYY